ncbi:MAG: hypothetical protein R3Y68_07695 [Rikenellaceae bacterium]
MNIFKKITAAAIGLLLCSGLEASAASNATESVTVNNLQSTVVGSELNIVNEEGGIVPISFVVHVPHGAFSMDCARVYTPVLVNGKYRKELPAMIVKGRSYDIETTDEARFKEKEYEEGVYHASYVKPIFKGVDALYEIELDFECEMRGSKLQIEIDEQNFNSGIKQGKSWWMYTTDTPLPVIATIDGGVVDYTNFIKYDQTTFTYENSVIEETFGDKSVFVVKSTKMIGDAFDAPFKAMMCNVDSLINDCGVRINSMDVEVTASIEGPYAQNAKLAAAREAVVKKAVEGRLPKLCKSVVTYTHKDENWDDFVAYASDKEFFEGEVSQIIKFTDDYDEREMMLMATPYRKEILEICQNQRNCRIAVGYTTTTAKRNCAGFVLVDDINEMEDETIEVDGCDLMVCNKMVELMKDGEYFKAYRVYQQIEGDVSPTMANNIGVLMTFIGDYPMAKHYFDKAEGVKCVEYNVAMMYMAAKDYAAASEAFGDKVCTHSIVANIAAKNYQRAIELTLADKKECCKAKKCCSVKYVESPVKCEKVTPECDKESKAFYTYLRAIAYTYELNDKMAIFALRQAFELDPSLKLLAMNQAEFVPLRDVKSFKKIIKIVNF